ncbi:FkbM family methyltransferase [Inconstantimicrobium mannanitabidum]|uniref:Uncharacterized protein n=1 Tax=Inconstantimicrobium mannanitabidum TaxID=1604901 RepID=A0ACB5R923_9CLOT|nr:FkbM family methyltransferase [Clostridium sp. TW13]GKX65531.1 hypothetical protein rsdtw13_07890 [Clostridium sp. TW13]
MDLIRELGKHKVEYFKKSEFYKIIKDKDLVVFSASTGGKKIIDYLSQYNMKVKYILDNNQKLQQGYINKIKIISVEQFTHEKQFNDMLVLIGSNNYLEQMKNQLLENGVKEQNIITPDLISDRFAYFLGDGINDRQIIQANINEIEKVINMLDDEKSKFIYKDVLQIRYDDFLEVDKREQKIAIHPQYFNNEIFELTDNEVFLDIGSYNGDTIIEFKNYVNGKYKCIYGFEPETSLYEIACENTKNIKNLELFKLGLSSKNTRLKFKSEGAGSRSCDDNEEFDFYIDTIRGDELFIDKKPTYIKMDIEGEEMRALEGLKETIIKFKPKLAICIYHRNAYDQFWRVPIYIKELVPEYKIKIRNHGFDTVCYASI